ncbi:hypothetical protein CBS101457_006932 [Exobasidium rhododendri]|nr:hypothetical protein CBS101457_006932 [Exobasidium rhododendri]
MRLSAQALYRRFASVQWQCGDCLIAHLTKMSGETGLEAFLPEASLNMPGQIHSSDHPLDPVLPLRKNFDLVDYSLTNVAKTIKWGGLNRRLFVAHLINRYKYLVAHGQSHGEVAIVSVEREEEVIMLQGLLRAWPPAIFAVGSQTAHPRFQNVLDEFFPHPLPFEV